MEEYDKWLAADRNIRELRFSLSTILEKMTSRFAFLRKQSLVDLLRCLLTVSTSKALRSAFCTVQANYADVFVLRYLMEHEFNALTPVDDPEYLLSLEVLQSCVLIDSVTSKTYALKKDAVGFALKRFDVPSMRPCAFATLSALLMDASEEFTATLADKDYVREIIGIFKTKEVEINANVAPIVLRLVAALQSSSKSREIFAKEYGAGFEEEWKKVLASDPKAKDFAEPVAKLLQ